MKLGSHGSDNNAAAKALLLQCSGRKGSGSTRRGSRESEKQRIRSRGTTAARSPADGGTQPAAGAAAVAPGVAGAAAGAGAGAAANGKDSAKAQLRKD
jgi:hypothetical protein